MKTRTLVRLLGALALGGMLYFGWRIVNPTIPSMTPGFFTVELDALSADALDDTMMILVTTTPAHDTPYTYVWVRLDPGLILASEVPTQLLDLKKDQPQHFQFLVTVAALGEQRITVEIGGGPQQIINGFDYLWLDVDPNRIKVRHKPRPRPDSGGPFLIPLDQMPTSKPTAIR